VRHPFNVWQTAGCGRRVIGSRGHILDLAGRMTLRRGKKGKPSSNASGTGPRLATIEPGRVPSETGKVRSDSTHHFRPMT
jgi:hypothetical protein